MKTKDYLKLHPEKYVIGTSEFGDGYFYICLSKDGKANVELTTEKGEALVFSALDNQELKLSYYSTITGYKQLQFIKL